MQQRGPPAEDEAALLNGSAATFGQEVTFSQEVVEVPKPHTPLWAWALLVAAVFAVSSAAVTFAMIAEVPPITLAAWRLQLTSVFLGIGAAVQLRRMPPDDRRRTHRAAGMLAASGTCLCFHFGLWVLSVETTSLAHSLLFVSATPLFLAAGALLLRQPISSGELAGTAMGVAGAVVLATAAARTDAEVTLRGDLAALTASLCFVGYLLVGKRLRAWMPAFVYAFSVTGLAATLLTLGALAFEGASLSAVGKHGAFGWAASSHHLPYVLYLAIVPGIVGHTGFNTLLRYLDPLLISLACNMEPLIGSLLGWALGLVSPPGRWTYVGGGLVLASTCAVSLASHLRERRQAAAAVSGKEAAWHLLGRGGEDAKSADVEGGADQRPEAGSWRNQEPAQGAAAVPPDL